MSFFDIISLLGGLALFLYGMSILGTGLEKVSGGRLEQTLEKLTDNVFKSVLLGAVVTAAVQSSSATTVIVVGLVNAKILKLKQAIGVIMGANIGTTVTAHILRLTDIDSSNFFLNLLKPTTLAPAVAIIGVVLFMSAKKNKRKDIGQILIGFGILFTGMFNMEAAVFSLRELPQFADMFASFSNPVLGVLIGAGVTAIIQSSSASVGILQALSSTGSITYSSAFPIIMGQNIGTCITPLLASIGATKNAKRSAMVHLTFNIIGTAVFLIATYSLNSLLQFPFWELPIDKGGIANFHTIFNVTITLLFMPFAGWLEKLANLIVPSKPGDIDSDEQTMELDERFMVSPGLAIDHSRKSVSVMAQLAYENFKDSMLLLNKYDTKVIERIKEKENTIDKLESRLENYLLKLSERELTENDSRGVSELLHIMSEFERIGDYSVNIMESGLQLFETDTQFSKKAVLELQAIGDAVEEIIRMSVQSFASNDCKLSHQIEPLEEVIDDIEETLKARHIDRLKQGKCSIEAAFPYVEALSNIERISDHCSNIAIYIIGHNAENRDIDRHEFIKNLHKSESGDYAILYKQYEQKYYNRII